MGKDKDKDREKDSRGGRRRRGESNEELIRRLGRNVSRGQQQCGACKGSGTTLVPRDKDMGGGKVRRVMNPETCKACHGNGILPDRNR